MKSKLLLLVSAILAGPLCAAAFAQENPNYGEVTVGITKFTLDKSSFTRNSLTVTSEDTSSIGYTWRYGRFLNSNWGMDLAFVTSGYMNVRGTDSTGAAWSVSMRVNNWTGGATYRHSLTDKLDIFARAGALAFEAEYGKSALVQKILYDQERGTGVYFGVGANMKMMGRFSLTGAVDYYNGRQKSTEISGGLRVAF